MAYLNSKFITKKLTEPHGFLDIGGANNKLNFSSGEGNSELLLGLPRNSTPTKWENKARNRLMGIKITCLVSQSRQP